MSHLLSGNNDETWMQAALKEAARAFDKGEVPVGAVAIYKNQIIGRGHNQVETLKDATAHAEILALTAAMQYLDSWRLEEVTLYATLEPCCMCAGAVVLARVPRLVFAAFDPKAGACGSLFNLVADPRLNHRVVVAHSVSAEESQALLQEFFRKLRVEEKS